VSRRIEPMKAVLTDERFSDPGWIFERKLDGIRCIAVKDRDRVKLLSRTDRDQTGSYPGVAAALRRDPARDLIVDGELVAFRSGITSFEALQQRGRRDVAIYLYVFDILRFDGRHVTGLPLRERKSLLRRSLEFEDPIRYLPHRNRDGEALFREACKKGLEGLIAKRADSTYVQGRSRDWLKFKCGHEQELVIGGFTAPQGSRTEFGALLVGYYEDGDLRYAGKVGTGFTRATLKSLGKEMRARARHAALRGRPPDPPGDPLGRAGARGADRLR
jgi:DNA ligase D-like protein (predicted ligase)